MKNVLLIPFTILCLFFFLESCNSNADSKIDTKKIKSIKVGMSATDVISILGNPVQTENRYENMGKTFTYTRVPKYSMTYPMLWVHFDKNDNVSQVYSKKYIHWGGDDECIYILDSNSNLKNQNTKQLKEMFE